MLSIETFHRGVGCLAQLPIAKDALDVAAEVFAIVASSVKLVA